MTFSSMDAATGQKLQDYPEWDRPGLGQALDRAAGAFAGWASLEVGERCKKLRGLAGVLRRRRDGYAELMSREMGKTLAEARAEVEKCAGACEYYADEAPRMLADLIIPTDAKRS